MNASIKIENTSFQFKADFYPLTVMKITEANLQTIAHQLQQTIQKAPQYFNHAPVVLDVQHCTDQENNLDIFGICQLLRQQKIIPIGIRGLESKLHDVALSLGLALMKMPQEEEDNDGNTKISQRSKTAKNNCSPTKTITTPIRSGTQVYAQGGDLLILAAVNSGAECIADGNIHIYGPLRGRALAGAQGDQSARIFCAALDAELISIAGFYLVKENIQQPVINKAMTQIYLKDQQIQIEGI